MMHCSQMLAILPCGCIAYKFKNTQMWRQLQFYHCHLSTHPSKSGSQGTSLSLTTRTIHTYTSRHNLNSLCWAKRWQCLKDCINLICFISRAILKCAPCLFFPLNNIAHYLITPMLYIDILDRYLLYWNGISQSMVCSHPHSAHGLLGLLHAGALCGCPLWQQVGAAQVGRCKDDAINKVFWVTWTWHWMDHKLLLGHRFVLTL